MLTLIKLGVSRGGSDEDVFEITTQHGEKGTANSTGGFRDYLPKNTHTSNKCAAPSVFGPSGLLKNLSVIVYMSVLARA